MARIRSGLQRHPGCRQQPRGVAGAALDHGVDRRADLEDRPAGYHRVDAGRRSLSSNFRVKVRDQPSRSGPGQGSPHRVARWKNRLRPVRSTLSIALQCSGMLPCCSGFFPLRRVGIRRPEAAPIHDRARWTLASMRKAGVAEPPSHERTQQFRMRGKRRHPMP